MIETGKVECIVAFEIVLHGPYDPKIVWPNPPPAKRTLLLRVRDEQGELAAVDYGGTVSVRFGETTEHALRVIALVLAELGIPHLPQSGTIFNSTEKSIGEED